MRILSLLFVLIIVVTFTSNAQSHENKGCGKEKECVVKTCGDQETEADVIIKNEDGKTTKTVIKKNSGTVNSTEVKKNKTVTVKKEVVKKKE